MDTIGIVDKLASQDHTEAEDYTEDGLLMCSKCHTPKQTRTCLPNLEGEMREQTVPIMCPCRKAEREREEAEANREQFRFRMDKLQEQFSITEQAYRGISFDGDDRRNAKLSDICRKFVEQWVDMKADNMGMLLYGSVGTGKSFYACCIVNALLQNRVPAAVTNFPRLLNLLQSARDRQALVDHLQSYQCLVIDDLGVERDSSYAAEQVFNVIDARARSGLPLIVTTNLTMDELKAPPTMQYARIYDRVLELCPISIKMVGQSRRAGNTEAKKAKARSLLGV